MTYTMEQYRESARAVRARLGDFAPQIAMVLGSGLGSLGDQVEDPIFVDYRDIPHFKCLHRPGTQGAAGVRHPGGPAGGRDAGADAPLRGLLL